MKWGCVIWPCLMFTETQHTCFVQCSFLDSSFDCLCVSLLCHVYAGLLLYNLKNLQKGINDTEYGIGNNKGSSLRLLITVAHFVFKNKVCVQSWSLHSIWWLIIIIHFYLVLSLTQNIKSESLCNIRSPPYYAIFFYQYCIHDWATTLSTARRHVASPNANWLCQFIEVLAVCWCRTQHGSCYSRGPHRAPLFSAPCLANDVLMAYLKKRIHKVFGRAAALCNPMLFSGAEGTCVFGCGSWWQTVDVHLSPEC